MNIQKFQAKAYDSCFGAGLLSRTKPVQLNKTLHKAALVQGCDGTWTAWPCSAAASAFSGHAVVLQKGCELRACSTRASQSTRQGMAPDPTQQEHIQCQDRCVSTGTAEGGLRLESEPFLSAAQPEPWDGLGWKGP